MVSQFSHFLNVVKRIQQFIKRIVYEEVTWERAVYCIFQLYPQKSGKIQHTADRCISKSLYFSNSSLYFSIFTLKICKNTDDLSHHSPISEALVSTAKRVKRNITAGMLLALHLALHRAFHLAT